MKFWVNKSTDLKGAGGQLLVVPCFSGDFGDEVALESHSFAQMNELTGSNLLSQARGEAFDGANGTHVMQFLDDRFAAGKVMLLGLGKRSAVTADTLKAAFASAFKQVKASKAAEVTFDAKPILANGLFGAYELGQLLAVNARVVGHTLKHYKTKGGGLKTDVRLDTLRVLTEAEHQDDVKRGLYAGRSIGYGINLARDLVTTPAGELTPMRLMDVARGIEARSQGLVKGTYYWGKRLKELGANALIAVGQGSAEPPVLIELDYTPPTGPTKSVLCLIGKSVTFDSGGLDLKPAEGMREMKRDMSGGATVLGALQAIIDLKLPISVKVVMAATENMTGSRAYKPGDVIKSLNGLTIEVDNTDAEGRLTLADAIEYAKRRNVTHMVDFATLTGAVISIGGDVGAACFGNNALFTKTVRETAASQGEKMIEMPMWPELRSLIDSDIADLKNSGGRLAGSTTAAMFLKEFAGDEIPWVHVDIAGVAFRGRELEGLPKGATGYGVRTAVALASVLAQEAAAQS